MTYSILYLTYDGLSDPLGQSQILPYLHGLANRGHDIMVISFEKSSFAIATEDKKLKTIQLKYHKSPPVLSTLYDLYLLKKEVEKMLKTQQVDIIHCRSYVMSLVGLWAKRKYDVKFIFDMRGFWADERVEGGLWNLSNPVFRLIYGYFKKKEKDFLLEANAVVSLTQNAKSEIEQKIIPRPQIIKSSNQSINISVIPTCVDPEHFHPGKISPGRTAELRTELGIQPTDFVLLYLGSLGTWYMLDEMLDFFENLKAEIGNQKICKFLFLTKDQVVLKEAMRKRNIQDNEIIITLCERQKVPDYIALCNASIFFIIPTYSKKASAATKMGEVMAMGKPVITNAGWGDVDTIIPETGVGVLVNLFGPEGYVEAINIFDKMQFDQETIRRQAIRLFSLTNGIDQIDEMYSNVMGS
jgi:glycosyltransferase involved in cell wall biosynthesis